MPEKDAVYTIGALQRNNEAMLRGFESGQDAMDALNFAMMSLAKKSEKSQPGNKTGGKMKYTLMNETKDIPFDGNVDTPGSIIPLVYMPLVGQERLVFAHWNSESAKGTLIAFPDEGTWILARNQDYKYRHLRPGESVSFKGGKWSLGPAPGTSDTIPASQLKHGECAILVAPCTLAGKWFVSGSILQMMDGSVHISGGGIEAWTSDYGPALVRRLRPGEWIKVEPA